MLKETVNKIKRKFSDEGDYDSWDEEDYEERDNSRWELEFQDILSDYEHRLKGEVRAQDGKWHKRVGVKPRLNDVGVSLVISELAPLCNRGTALAYTDDKYAKTLAREKATYFNHKLCNDPKKYGINDLLDIPSLVLDFYHQVFSVLSRSVKGREQKLRAKRYKDNDNFDREKEDEGYKL